MPLLKLSPIKDLDKYKELKQEDVSADEINYFFFFCICVKMCGFNLPDIIIEDHKDSFAEFEKNNNDSAQTILYIIRKSYDIKKIKASNISKLLNAISIEGSLGIKFNELTPYIPSGILCPGDISDVKFYEYHTTANSTASLVQRAYSSMGDLAVTLGGTLGDLSTTSPDSGATLRQILLTYAYLEEMEQLPSNWYQGKKALNTGDPVLFERMKICCKKYKELMSKSKKIDDAKDLKTLLEAAKEIK